MTTVSVKVPTRIDLAGGTIDLWPIHSLMDKASTVNFGISIYQSASLTLNHASMDIVVVSDDLDQSFSTNYQNIKQGSELALIRALIAEFWSEKLPGFSLTTSCQSPAGAGLGGSSCLSIAIASALIEARGIARGEQIKVDERKLVETVQNVEARIITAPTGCQDYWGGVRGRVNILDFPNSGLEIETFHDDTLKDLLDKRLIVAFSGKSRKSAMNNWQIFKNVFDGDEKTLKMLSEIGRLGFEVGQKLRAGDVMAGLAYSLKEWEVRKKLWAGIESKETQALDHAARGSGAMFSRVCGAGGGGVMAFFSEESKREAVKKAINNAGGVVMDAVIASQGVEVSIKKSKRQESAVGQYV